jgi:hypothetical protein
LADADLADYGNVGTDACHYSGGSESGMTINAFDPMATAPASWGEIKSLYR